MGFSFQNVAIQYNAIENMTTFSYHCPIRFLVSFIFVVVKFFLLGVGGIIDGFGRIGILLGPVLEHLKMQLQQLFHQS